MLAIAFQLLYFGSFCFAACGLYVGTNGNSWKGALSIFLYFLQFLVLIVLGVFSVACNFKVLLTPFDDFCQKMQELGQVR